MLVPLGADRALAAALRAEGWITVAALRAEPDWREEALRLDCGYVLEGGQPRPSGGFEQT